MSDDFRKRLDSEKPVERAVADWLINVRGSHILATCEYSGLGDRKAPKLEGAPHLVLPDFLSFRGGRASFIEVKHKAGADWTHTKRRWETGIDLRLWQQYLAVERVTRIPVWLFFLHDKEAELRAEALATLVDTARPSPNFNQGRGGVFFAWESLRLLATLDDVLRFRRPS